MDLEERNASSELLCNETATANRTFECEAFGLRVFHGMFMMLILLASLGLNFTVLALLLRYKKLRNKSVLGLIVADIMMSTVWVFQGEASTIAGEWPFGDVGCSILSYLYVTLLFVRWLEVLAFTTDRFCQILFPFWYQRWSTTLLICSTVLAWSLPAVLSLPPAALGLSSYYLSLTACSVNCGDDMSCSSGVIALFGIFILTGGIAPTIMYIIIYIYGRKKTQSMKYSLKMGTGEGIPKNDSHDRSTAKFLNVLHNRKAIITCLLVFITNVITNVPLYITSSLRNQEQIYRHIPIWLHFVIMYIFLLGPILDPIVVMRTRDFRETIRKLVCCERRGLDGTVAVGLRSIITLGLLAQEPRKSYSSQSDTFGSGSSDANPEANNNSLIKSIQPSPPPT